MSMEQELHWLRERDITLSVRKREGGSSALPLLLLHGWPASSRGWERVVEAMPDDRTVICPDLRGLGDSERAGKMENFSKFELARDIVALTEKLGFDEFVVAGQDWGGTVAQEVALALPERARALIVMNINLINNPAGNLAGYREQMASPLNPRWYMAFQSATGLAEAMIPGNEEPWIRYFFEQGAGLDVKIPEDLVAGYVADYSREGTARCGANYYRAMALDAARWASLSEVKFEQPSLLIYGAQDPFLVPAFYDGFESCFVNVKRVDLPAGHFVQDELPTETASAMADFLQDLG